MEPDPVLLEELKYLVSKRHKWYRNPLRTNLAASKDDIIVDGTFRKLKVGIYVNGVRPGQNPTSDRMLEIVQTMLPDAGINTLTLNRNVCCPPHRDKRNTSPQSYILAWGQYAGGALLLEYDRTLNQ